MLNETANMDTQISTPMRAGAELQYDPNQLLDSLLEHLRLKNDAALSRALEVAPPVISKIRHRRLPVSASMLIRMHEVTGFTIRDLRFLMGDRRAVFSVAALLHNHG